MKHRNPLSAKQLALAISVFLTFSAVTAFLFTYKQDEKRFIHITSSLFVEEMRSNTLNMHYTLAYPENYGIYDYEPVLACYDSTDSMQDHAAMENTVNALRSIHTENLSDTDAWLCTLLTRSLENSLAMADYPYYNEPLAPNSGMQSQLPILLAEYAFRSKRDITDYLALLDQTDEYFASLLAFEQEKAAAGLIMPASSLQEVRKQCDTIVTKSDLENGTHFLQTTFEERLTPLIQSGIITRDEADSYIAQNDRLLKTVLLPAYIALGDGLILLEDDAVPLSGLGSTEAGKEYYQYLLISETGSYRSVEEIQLLLVNKFKEEYEAIHNLVTAYPDYFADNGDSSQADFPYTDAAGMLADLQKRMQGQFPPVSGEPTVVTVRPVSPSLEKYTAPAFYITSPRDDSTQNTIHINTSKTPKGLELYTTLAHEGYPGHLYQTVYNNRNALEQKERPARELLWYGGYLEGWALYVEFISYDYVSELMQEQGRSADAVMTEVEKHNRSMQLCLYSMLDIMIHYEGASYNQIAEVLEGFGITNSNSIRAVYAYIAQEPCNYLKYYLGYLEILSLQEQAKKLWGDEYSEYRFHCFYLDCGPSDFLSLRERLEEVRE
ncbi:MAG: DUF885 domain-containing protein [Acetatifactor sp.]|nr:DUF885 domain-containing protein [Acetatifactor sp.]MDE7044868.1 DUF885 domain-containing protein [Acetatifactor sp.]